MTMMRIRAVIANESGLPGLYTLYANGASSTPVAADALDMVNRVRAFWFAIVSLIPSAVVVNVSPQVDLIDPTEGELVGALNPATPAQVAGTGGSALPFAAMALLVLNTGAVVNGRRLQGRSFIGPLSTTVNADGLFGASQRTTLSNAAATMLTGTTASVPVVWHRPKETPPDVGSASVVSSFTARAPFAVLRSRRD